MALTVEEVQAVLTLRDEMSTDLAKARSSLSSLGSTAARVGAGLTAGITLPMVAVAGSAIKMAMAAVESENLFEVSFKGMAKQARAWSEELSASLGLNDFELRKTSATMFTMFDSMKMGTQASFDMSTSLTKLAYDMASFRNINPEEAFTKLQAGITGEAEPLKRLGILIDENTIKTAAYSAGIAKQGEELTQQQKVLARYHAIMEQTKNDQGDLARTLDSPTNQLRLMREQVNKLSVELGMALLPAFTQILSTVKSLMPYLQDAVKWFTGLSPTTKTWAIGLLAVGAAIGPLVIALGGLAFAITTISTLVVAPAFVGFLAIAAPITAIGVAVGILAYQFSTLGDQVKRAGPLASVAERQILGVGEAAKLTTEAFKKLDQAPLKNGFAVFIKGADDATSAVKVLTDAQRKAAEALVTQRRQAINLVGEMEIEAIARSQELAKTARELDTAGLKQEQDGIRAYHEWLAASEQESISTQIALTNTMFDEKEKAWREYNNMLGVLLQEQDARVLASAKRTSEGVQSAIAGMGASALQAIQGGGNIGKAMGASFGGDMAKMGSDAFKNIGGMLGKTLGAVVPVLGPLLGGLAGAGIGKLFGKLFGSEGKEVKKLQTQFKDLLSSAKDVGINVQAAFNAKNVKAFNAALEDIKRQMEEYNQKVQEANDFTSKLPAVLDTVAKSGVLVTKEFAAALQTLKAVGMTAEDVAAFFKGQFLSAIAGVAQFLDNATFTTQAGADAIVGALWSAFQGLVEGGMSARDAFTELQPVFENFQEQLRKSGLTGSAAFAELQAMAVVAHDTVAGPLMSAFHGLTQVMTGMHNSGMLNQEMFAGLAGEAALAFQRILASGASATAALRLMAPDLQTIWELQQDFGYEVDEGTQAMLDMAVQAGLVGDAQRSAQEVAQKAMKETVEVLKEIADLLRELSKEIVIRVHTEYSSSTTPLGEGDFTSFAHEGRVTRPTLGVIGDAPEPEFVLRESTLSGLLSDATSNQGRVHDSDVHEEIKGMRTDLKQLPLLLGLAMRDTALLRN